MSDFRDMLRMGPKITYQREEGTPHIYAGPDEWLAYRQQQAGDKLQQVSTEAAAIDQLAVDRMTAHLLASTQATADMDRELQSLASRFPSASVLDATPPMTETDVANKGPKHAKEDLINQNWNAAGIKAFTDEKGQLVLTNNPGATDARSAMKPFGSSAPGNFNAPGTQAKSSLNHLVASMKNAKDAAEARGIAESGIMALAEEKTRLETEAHSMAQRKLGLPTLQRELEAAINADRADPLYRPGMGDSPITSKIRAQILQIQDQADQEARRYLSRNISYASVDATAKILDAELKRRESEAARAQQREEASQGRIEERRAIREMQREEAASQMTVQERQRIIALNPELAADSNPTAIFSAAERLVKTGGNEAKEALNIPDADIPLAAARGNRYAADIFVQEEASRTGQTTDEVRKELRQIQALVTDPTKLQAAMNRFRPGEKESDRKARMVAMQQLDAEVKLNRGAEATARLNNFRASQALDIYRAQATDIYASDLTKARVNDPKFQAALQEAIRTTGRADLESVLAAYVGKESSLNSFKEFKRLLQTDVDRRKGGTLGVPDYMALSAVIDTKARQSSNIAGYTAVASGGGMAVTPNMVNFLLNPGQDIFGVKQ